MVAQECETDLRGRPLTCDRGPSRVRKKVRRKYDAATADVRRSTAVPLYLQKLVDSLDHGGVCTVTPGGLTSYIRRDKLQGNFMMKKKTEMVLIRMTLEDKTAIQKAAARENMGMSEYIRAACLTYMFARGDKHAFTAALQGAKNILEDFEQQAKQQFFGGRKVKA